MLDLLRYLLVSIEEEVQKDPESSTFSVFLIFRLAFSVYIPPKTQKSTIGISLLNALNINSFVTPSSSPPSHDEGHASTTKADTFRKHAPGRRPKIPRELPTIAISDTDEETEEFHFLRKAHRRGRRESSPLLRQKRQSTPLLSYNHTAASATPPLALARPKSPTMDSAQDGPKSVSPLVASSAGEVSPRPGGGAYDADVGTPASSEVGGSRESSLPSELEEGGHGTGGGAEGKGKEEGGGVIVDAPPLEARGKETAQENDQQEQKGQLSQRESENSLFQEVEISLPPSSPTPSPRLRGKRIMNRQAESYPSLHTRSYELSPLEASVPPSPQPQQPTLERVTTPENIAMPTKQALLLSELINSPRFYHPREGQDLTGCTFLYRELVKALGHSRNFLLTRHFWNQTFISTLTMERESLGWNEWTVSLYEK